jgi:uncharacterized protein YoxC
MSEGMEYMLSLLLITCAFNFICIIYLITRGTHKTNKLLDKINWDMQTLRHDLWVISELKKMADGDIKITKEEPKNDR